MRNALRRLARTCAAIAGAVKSTLRDPAIDPADAFQTPPESMAELTDSSQSRTPPFLSWSEIDSDWGDDDDIDL
eukprot:CAMPEP_0175902666 /NCGR_PEP_ID=MMETSP0108-20121206/3512_1 /TAXON_ID=195067 ORGANISM="Goniomonas pacifica, Strain CCMP1869" /NCGR_SAMPLE_ID=MMETSP0108 /ASSEMBLY_ACC=CAM_ASM_000204 /LENGTH=73 /DNA_ID=CAMNT_0017224321 /DNA_START=1 /DNA_END=218 /DNA_ORIENTATION=+